MHLAIFLVLGPLLAMTFALYGAPPLMELLGAGAASRSGVNATMRLGLPPMPVAYALGFLPALATARVDHLLHEMEVATPFRAFVTGITASLFTPLIVLLATISMLGNPKMLVVVGLIGFLPGLICSLLGGLVWGQR